MSCRFSGTPAELLTAYNVIDDLNVVIRMNDNYPAGMSSTQITKNGMFKELVLA